MSEETTNTNTQRISIPGDTVNKAMERLLESGELDDAGRKEILWFYAYAMANNWTLEDAGKEIKRDATTMHRLFTGRYGAKYDGLVEAIKKFHTLADARGNRKKMAFIETATWHKIDAVCRNTLENQITAFIFGDSQIGKTTCLEEFARRNNHGQTKYIRIPIPSALKNVMYVLAEACYISPRLSENELSRRIINAIGRNTLLIIDEFHEPFITSSPRTAAKIMEWLRYVHGETNCGMVFCSTNVGKEELKNGPQALMLAQCWKRGMITLELPPVPPKSDVNLFAKHFGLPPPTGEEWNIIQTMLKEKGIKQYVLFLQAASNLAANQNKPVSWDHFITAYDKVQSLSKG